MRVFNRISRIFSGNICYIEKSTAEDTSDKYRNLNAQRYAYSISLSTTTKLQVTDTICGIVKIVNLIWYQAAFVYNLLRI